MMNTTRNTENMDELSEISTLRSSETTVYPHDNESLEQIFENMYSEMKAVLRKLDPLIRKTSVLPRPSCTTVNNEKTVVLRELETLLENKTRIVSELTKAINNSTDYEFPRFRGDAILSIPLKLQEGTADCQQLLERLENNNVKYQNYIDMLSKSKRFLEDMNKNLVSLNHTSQEIARITSIVNKEYKECKRDLNKFFETVLPDPRVKEIIGELIEKAESNEDGEEWYEVTDADLLPVILKLQDYDIIVSNPQNEKLIKIILD